MIEGGGVMKKIKVYHNDALSKFLISSNWTHIVHDLRPDRLR